jgi:hypothetical protein
MRTFLNRHDSVQISEDLVAHTVHRISGIGKFERVICVDFAGCVGPGERGL